MTSSWSLIRPSARASSAARVSQELQVLRGESFRPDLLRPMKTQPAGGPLRRRKWAARARSRRPRERGAARGPGRDGVLDASSSAAQMDGAGSGRQAGKAAATSSSSPLSQTPRAPPPRSRRRGRPGRRPSPRAAPRPGRLSRSPASSPGAEGVLGRGGEAGDRLPVVAAAPEKRLIHESLDPLPCRGERGRRHEGRGHRDAAPARPGPSRRKAASGPRRPAGRPRR
jgi:hypothetical protein